MTRNDIPDTVRNLIVRATELEIISPVDAYMMGLKYGTDWISFTRAVLVASEVDESLGKRSLEQIRKMTVQVWNEIG